MARRPDFSACLLITMFLPLCWLWMQVVHELGHVLGAWLFGGRVTHVALHPLAISRTDVDPNPHPVLVVWAGPIIGVAFPVAAWGALAGWKAIRHLARFFAGFCLVANGAYIGMGPWFPVGDAAIMLKYHAAWPLAVFGVVTFAFGLLLWHGQGPWFGLGDEPERVSDRTVLVVAALLAGTIVLESLVG